MSVTIEAIRIFDEFNAGSVDYLLGNIGDKITVEVDFFVENLLIAQTTDETDGDDYVVLNPPNTLSGVLVNTDVILSNVPYFADYNVGDDILISGAVTGGNDGTYTVTEKISDFIIRTDGTYTNDNISVGGYLALVTPMTGVSYFFNFLENLDPDNFNNLIDGDISMANTDFADDTVLTNIDMDFTGKKSYQIGTAQIKGRTSAAGRQAFTVTHDTFITPLFLANQYDTTVARTAPDYYLNGNTLKYAIKIEAGRSLNDPNAVQSTDQQDINLLGNVGWFNERFNGNVNNYFVDSYSIERVSDSEALNALEITNEVEATIIIKNTVSSPFVSAASKVTVNINYLPSEETYYQDNGNTFIENFLFDRVQATVAGGSVTGDNLGTDQQMIKLVTATFTSSSEIQVVVRIDIAAAAQALILSRDLKRYQLFIALQDNTLTRTTSDRASLLVDVNDFIVELFQTDLITSSTTFIQHRYTDSADGVTTPEVFPVDDIVAYSPFSIDFAGKTADGIKILSVTNQIVLTHATEADILLENSTISTESSPFELGYVPFIDEQKDRVFKIPASIRKTIDIQRDSALDAGTVFNWFCSYPFMQRWEYWKSIGTLTDLPTGIFDTAEPLNGLNHFWHRYTTIAGWTINHRLKFVVEQNGEVFDQSFTNDLISYDFNANAEWGVESIDTYDVDSGSPLVDGGTKFIQKYADTKVVATFDKISGTVPPVGDVEIVIWIEVYEQGGIEDVRRISSVYEIGADSWFKSTDTSNKVVVAKVGTVFTGECLIDSSKIPTESKFTIYARLYDNTTPLGDFKITEGGDFKITEASDNKIIE